MNGEKLGDFATDMLNVFRAGDDYLYLYAEKGSQVVLKAGSMDELASLVEDRQYPWEFRDWKGSVNHDKRQAVEIPEVKTEFLKASALKEVEIIPTSSAKKKKAEDESYVPEYEVEEVRDDSKDEDVEKTQYAQFQSGADFQVALGNVGHSGRVIRSSGNLHFALGPDTSQRARDLRASIIR